MTATPKTKLTFYGGAGGVTGANFLLAVPPAGETETETETRAKKFLVDCGLFQGPKLADDPNYHPFPYAPAEIDALFVTHAHLDHIGRIPKLAREGFRGVIYSTPPTREMAELSLLDSLSVATKEARGNAEPPLFSERDVAAALRLWQVRDYHEPIELGGGLTARALDAGHILGSAMWRFERAGRALLITGDLGNSPAPLLPETEPATGADYLVMESVYGDRDHEDRSRRRELLEDVIEETMRGGGTLVVPAFSIERTQEMLYEIERLMEESRIPLVPVYIDSPLGIRITEIYKKFSRYLNREVAPTLNGRDGIFAFPQLHLTLSTEASRAIAHGPSRKIILAGSGMSTGGRVIHHEKLYLPDPKNTLLLVGYQTPGSLGRQLLDGAKLVRILGETVPVRARVATISGYSAHKDHSGLMGFVEQSAESLKQIFVVMGEPRASLFLVQRLRDYLGLDASAPGAGESATLEL